MVSDIVSETVGTNLIVTQLVTRKTSKYIIYIVFQMIAHFTFLFIKMDQGIWCENCYYICRVNGSVQT